MNFENQVVGLPMLTANWARRGESSVGLVIISFDFEKFLKSLVDANFFQGLIFCCLFYLSIHTLVC